MDLEFDDITGEENYDKNKGPMDQDSNTRQSQIEDTEGFESGDIITDIERIQRALTGGENAI